MKNEIIVKYTYEDWLQGKIGYLSLSGQLEIRDKDNYFTQGHDGSVLHLLKVSDEDWDSILNKKLDLFISASNIILKQLRELIRKLEKRSLDPKNVKAKFITSLEDIIEVGPIKSHSFDLENPIEILSKDFEYKKYKNLVTRDYFNIYKLVSPSWVHEDNANKKPVIAYALYLLLKELKFPDKILYTFDCLKNKNKILELYRFLSKVDYPILETSEENFLNLFSNVPVHEIIPIKWKATQSLLKFLIDKLDVKKIILHKNNQWVVLQACFPIAKKNIRKSDSINKKKYSKEIDFFNTL